MNRQPEDQTDNNQAPGWYKPISITALVWNIVGLLMFVITFTTSPETIAQWPEAEQALYNNTPVWATAAFAVAVFAGVIGCVLLLMKKALAFEVLVVSLVGVVVQNIHSFVLADTLAVYGAGALGLPTMVFLIGVGLIVLSNKAKNSGWIA